MARLFPGSQTTNTALRNPQILLPPPPAHRTATVIYHYYQPLHRDQQPGFPTIDKLSTAKVTACNQPLMPDSTSPSISHLRQIHWLTLHIAPMTTLTDAYDTTEVKYHPITLNSPTIISLRCTY